MVGRAKSETKKRQNAREAIDAFRARAVAAYKAELTKPKNKRRGARTVANDFVLLYKRETGLDIKIDHGFLIRQANGCRTKAQANAAGSWLTPEETEVIIQYAHECSDRGFPLSHRRLKEHVDEILQGRNASGFPLGGVGKQWTQRFVTKYSERLQTSWASSLESKRGRAVNEHTIKAWFDLVHAIRLKYKTKPCNIYGSDEVGTNAANGESERVIGRRKKTPQYQQRDGNRENITVFVTICVDGTCLLPVIIFKGAAHQVAWCQDNPAKAT